MAIGRIWRSWERGRSWGEAAGPHKPGVIENIAPLAASGPAVDASRAAWGLLQLSVDDSQQYPFRYILSAADKPLRWMIDTLTTPPVGENARVEAGVLLRRLQRGESIGLPDSRPMPSVGRRVHELRIADRAQRVSWRIVYRIDDDAILIVDWFEKKTQTTPTRAVELCRRRLRDYDHG